MRFPKFQRLSVFLLLGLFAWTLNSCVKGKGDIVQQSFESVEPFTGLELKDLFNVEVTLGGQQEVLAVGNQNIIDRLILNVDSDGVLNMELERGNYRDIQLTLYITVPYADYFKLAGSGNMTVFNNEAVTLDSLLLESTGSGMITGIGAFRVTDNAKADLTGSGNINFDLESGQLEVRSSGSGQMNLDFITNEVNATISGSGNLNFSGFCPTQHIMSTASGTYKGFNVDAQNTNVELSGSGSAEVKTSNQLNATISGSGSVFYKGTPIVNENITGSGAVVNAN
jgi:hypothetical protein